MLIRLWDLGYGLRRLGRRPVFSLVGVLTLALGSGATFAIFSILYAVLWSPLPFPEGERLVAVSEARKDSAGEPLAPAELAFWREAGTLSGIAGYKYWLMSLEGVSAPEMLLALQCTSELFNVLGVQPELGHGFARADEAPGVPPVVVVSHGLWRSQLGGDRNVIGSELLLEGTRHTVIGVMPAGFHFPLEEELPGQQVKLWTPLRLSPEQWADYSDHMLETVASLAPGRSLAQTQAQMNALAVRLDEMDPASRGYHKVNLIEVREQLVGNLKLSLAALFGGVICVYLICCANLGNLMLVHAVARERETAVKLALGGRRTDLVREWLVESLLLAAGGGALGLLVARWSLDLFRALNPVRLPRIDEVGMGIPVAIFALSVTLMAGAVSSLAAILQGRRVDLNTALKEGSRNAAGASGGRRRLTNGLVIFEVAASTVLAIVAVFLIGSFLKLQQVNPGFDPHRVLTAWIILPGARYPEAGQQEAFFRQLFDRLREVPGIDEAGGVSNLPLTNSTWGSSLRLTDGSGPAGGVTAELRVASPGYFRALKIVLLRGSSFDAAENAGGARVALVDEALAERLGGDVVGKHLTIDAASGEPWRIAGIVRSTRQASLASPPGPTVYVPHSQLPTPFLILTLRSKTDLETLVGHLRRTMLALDPNQPLFNLRTMEEIQAATVAEIRLRSFLLGLFALLSLALAVLGVYGAASQSLAERTQELAVRMALGATPHSVRTLILGTGIRLATLGVAVGIVVAIALMRVLASLLFGIEAGNLLVFAVVALALEGTTLLACSRPAFLAGQISPGRVVQSPG